MFGLMFGLVFASLSLTACSLIGVEPDEIDFAAGSETAAEAGASDDAGESGSGAEDGMTTVESTSSGDGDGDPTTGEPGDGDGAPGDGDGDPTDLLPCTELEPTPLHSGSNLISIPAGPSLLSGSCGHDGPEAVFSFTSEFDIAVDVELSLIGSDFDAALYAIDGDICLPLIELACVNTPMGLSASVSAGQTVYFVVDAADGNGGSGDLNLAILP